MEWIKICAIVPNNFGHKAGDGLGTRKHGLKHIHPALQALPGATQATYVLECKSDVVNKCRFQINS